ncbi:unnamed protein product [Caretta caretta]
MSSRLTGFVWTPGSLCHSHWALVTGPYQKLPATSSVSWGSLISICNSSKGFPEWYPCLTKSSKKTSAFVWMPEGQLVLEQLKRAFTSAPVLMLPDPSKPFIVEPDASDYTIEAILSQQQGSPSILPPYAFYSRKLTPTRLNYVIYDKELLAIKAAFEEQQHQGEGICFPIQMFTDHKNLEYLHSVKAFNQRQIQ